MCPEQRIEKQGWKATSAVVPLDHPFGNLAILTMLRTHGFASHPYGWFAFVVELGNYTRWGWRNPSRET
jgi:hypothetical protein